MCGLAGYVGIGSAQDVIVDILKGVDYRGYDAAGGAVMDLEGEIKIRRTIGGADQLEEFLKINPLPHANFAIGHTRWGTTGKSDDVQDAHPHDNEDVCLVHNGEVKNHGEIRQECVRKGYTIKSACDSAVIPPLIDSYLKEGLSPVDATRAATRRLRGDFALAILFKRRNLLVVTRRERPIVIGFKDAESFVGSDETALSAHADRVLHLEDEDIALVTLQGTTIFNSEGVEVEREVKTITMQHVLADKGPYRHFMRKEIDEQPEKFLATIDSMIDPSTSRIAFDGLPFDFRNVSLISGIGCGTAGYAVQTAKQWFEGLAGIKFEFIDASEFLLSESPMIEGQIGFFPSQSGETAETLSALKLFKQTHPTLSIVNAPQTAIARAAHKVIYTQAGPEICVASTKAFTTQLAVLLCLAIHAAAVRGRLDPEQEAEIVRELRSLPQHMQSVLNREDEFADLGKILSAARDIFFIGRGQNLPLALEAALKNRETAYIHGEGVPGGALKHGSFALITPDFPTVAIAPRDKTFGKMVTSVGEILSKGGPVFMLSDENLPLELSEIKELRTLLLPKVHSLLKPFVFTMAIHLLTYQIALACGTPIDKPRNLAKSVTVE